MGQSTDAVLFWGLCSKQEYTPPWEWNGKGDESEDEYDWENRLMTALGDPEPTVPYQDNKEVHQAYWKRKRETAAQYACEIDTHCSGDFPMYYVAIKASRVRAARGYPEVIEGLNVRPEWESQLREFCTLMGIPYSEPKWWLVSYWG